MKHTELEVDKSYVARSPKGDEILGTYEMVPGTALVSNFTKGDMDHGVAYEHAGETKLFWDAAITVEREHGTVDEKWVVYLCSDGEEWTVDDLVFEEI